MTLPVEEKSAKFTINGTDIPIGNLRFELSEEKLKIDDVSRSLWNDIQTSLEDDIRSLLSKDRSVALGTVRGTVDVKPNLRVNERLQLRPFMFAIKELTDATREVVIRAEVFDVYHERGDVPMGITFRLPIDPDLAGPARDEKIRSRVAWALMHELNETLRRSDGSPVRAPHPSGWVHPEIDDMLVESTMSGCEGGDGHCEGVGTEECRYSSLAFTVRAG